MTDEIDTYDGTWFSAINIGVAVSPNGSPVVISGLLMVSLDALSGEHALAETARWLAKLRHSA